MAEKNAAQISQASNHLAIQLYKLLAKENENVFFSPFSISTALAMVFCGADSETSTEMRQVLGYDIANIKDDNLKTCFGNLLSAFEGNPEAYTLSCANSVICQKDFDVKKEFKSLLEESFKALLQLADFKNEAQEAVKQVNSFVSDKTKGLIPNLLDSLDPDTVMVIVNAVYFKGFWMHTFEEKSTFKQYFYNGGIEDNAKQVDMMHLKKSFRYVEKESFKALELPYKGEDISMLILLPNSRDGLQELENEITSEFFQELKQTMCKKKVEVALPKFKLEYSKSLGDQLQSLGMKCAFTSAAHFSKISASKQICVSDVVHKAVIIVNEEGSEAAAATAVVMMLCSLTFDPEFIVDHPFVFAICDNRSDLILFMGRVDEL